MYGKTYNSIFRNELIMVVSYKYSKTQNSKKKKKKKNRV